MAQLQQALVMIVMFASLLAAQGAAPPTIEGIWLETYQVWTRQRSLCLSVFETEHPRGHRIGGVVRLLCNPAQHCYLSEESKVAL
jgi:hypothetical protein